MRTCPRMERTGTDGRWSEHVQDRGSDADRRCLRHVKQSIQTPSGGIARTSSSPRPSIRGSAGVTTEQLWARRVDDEHHEICCIPFFVYDLALGDTVEVDADHLVTRVVEPSGVTSSASTSARPASRATR